MDNLPLELWLKIISYNDSKIELIFMIDKNFLNKMKLDIYTNYYLNNKNNLMKEYNIFFMNKNKKKIYIEWTSLRPWEWLKLPKNNDNINWASLSTNPCAINLLEKASQLEL